ILLGPHMGNFADVTARLLAAGGAVQLPPAPAADPAMLADAAHGVLTDTRRADLLRQGAARVAEGASGLAEDVARTIAELLPQPPTPGTPRECQEERT
ncbi:3-deoxy-D-manno-octulosonic acid transferase, partial [Roseomonas sp. DSM 102946]|nr:3-deoxy-D-manno-octulosonic acid transferase [Roseomonas sp. DSM 102946]